MASYWKSQPRKFCEVCKCWIGDNKASIDFHERGKSHQEKKSKQLAEIKKRSMHQAKENSKADFYFKQMEEAARKSYVKDLKDQGITLKKSDEDQYFKKRSIINSETTSKSKKTEKPKKLQVVSKTATTSNSISKDLVSDNIKTMSSSQPYGKWVTIETETKAVDESTVCYTAAKSEPTQLNFTEKRAVVDDSLEPASFKKRKLNSNKKSRSIRSRNDAE